MDETENYTETEMIKSIKSKVKKYKGGVKDGRTPRSSEWKADDVLHVLNIKETSFNMESASPERKATRRLPSRL